MVVAVSNALKILLAGCILTAICIFILPIHSLCAQNSSSHIFASRNSSQTSSDQKTIGAFLTTQVPPSAMTEWNLTLPWAGQGTLYSVAKTGPNNYWAIGSLKPEGTDLYAGRITKFGLHGDILQQNDVIVNESCHTILFRVYPLADEGFLGLGWTAPPNNLQNSFGWLARFKHDGDTVWSKHFNDVQPNRLSDVTVLSDNSVVAVGRSKNSGNNSWDGWAVGVDLEHGNVNWEHHYGEEAGEGAISIRAFPDSGFVFCGWKQSGQNQQDDAWVVRCDTDGRLIWETQWGGEEAEVAYDIDIGINGNMIAVGYAAKMNDKNNDGLILCINARGQILWTKKRGGPGDDKLNSVVITPDMQMFAVGSKTTSIDRQYDAWFLHLNFLDDQVFEKVYDSTSSGRFFDIQMTNAHSAVIAGSVTPENAPIEVGRLMMLDLCSYLPFCHMKTGTAEQWLKLGDQLCSHNADNSAISAYTKAITIKPSGTAYNQRAYCFQKMGRNKDAMIDYNASLEENPFNNVAYDARKKLLQQVGSLLTKEKGDAYLEKNEAVHKDLDEHKPRMVFVNDGYIVFVRQNGSIVRTDIHGESPTLSSDGNLMGYTQTSLSDKSNSLDDTKSYCTERIVNEGIYILDFQSVKQSKIADRGDRPILSASGNRLAFTDNGRVVIYNITENRQFVLQNGFDPHWIGDEQLAYQAFGQVYKIDLSASKSKAILGRNDMLLFDFELMKFKDNLTKDSVLKTLRGKRVYSQSHISSYSHGRSLSFIQRDMRLSETDNYDLNISLILAENQQLIRSLKLFLTDDINKRSIQAFAISPNGKYAAFSFGPLPGDADFTTNSEGSDRSSELFYFPIPLKSHEKQYLSAPIRIGHYPFITDLDFWDDNNLFVSSVNLSKTHRFNNTTTCAIGLRDLTAASLQLMNIDKSILEADEIFRIEISPNGDIKSHRFSSGHSVSIRPRIQNDYSSLKMTLH